MKSLPFRSTLGPWLADHENFASLRWTVFPENIELEVALTCLERYAGGALCLLTVSRARDDAALQTSVGPVRLHCTRASAGGDFEPAMELQALLSSDVMAKTLRRRLPAVLLAP